LPSRLPGAAVAVITKSIGLSETFKPKTERFIAPVCNVRIVQVPVKLVKGMVIVWFTIVVTFPAISVKVPVIVPTALRMPFTNVKLLVVSVPVKVPTPGMTYMIAVVNDPPPGCATAGAVVTPSGKATIIKAMNRPISLRRSNMFVLLQFGIDGNEDGVSDHDLLLRKRVQLEEKTAPFLNVRFIATENVSRSWGNYRVTKGRIRFTFPCEGKPARDVSRRERVGWLRSWLDGVGKYPCEHAMKSRLRGSV